MIQTTFAVSAILAAVATWAASEVFSARWVPILVLGGVGLIIVQQRSRWQDRTAMYMSAAADLQALRDGQYASGHLPDLEKLVTSVEYVLERENAGWLHNMGEAPPDTSPLG